MASAIASRGVSSRSGLRTRQTPRTRLVCKAVARQSWLPGSQLPTYLTGTLPGDYGFDPLGLGSDPEALKWYVQSEVFHCRTAMAGVAGILIPSALTKVGILNVPDWYYAGKVAQDGSDIPFGALLAVELFLAGFVESKRWMDILKPGSQAEKGSFFGFEGAIAGSGDVGYPGGVFDPLGFAKDASKLQEWKTKEIKNGRLAMLAFLGFVAQHAATGKDPLDNLADHLADPWHNTFAENGVSVPFL